MGQDTKTYTEKKHAMQQLIEKWKWNTEVSKKKYERYKLNILHYLKWSSTSQNTHPFKNVSQWKDFTKRSGMKILHK